MNEFSMILRDDLLNDERYITRAVKMLDEGIARKEFIETISDRIRDKVTDWYRYDSDEDYTCDKLIGVMLRNIDFKDIALFIYQEAVEAKKELDAQRAAATAEYEKMVSDGDPELMDSISRNVKYYEGDVDKMTKALKSIEYYRLLDARKIKSEISSEATKAYHDAELINYRPTAEMACARYQAQTVA